MRLEIDGISKVLIISLVCVQFFLPNGFYFFVPSIITVFLLYYLQQPYKSSIFTLMLLWHFIQIYASPILIDYWGKEIDEKTAHTSTAIILSSIGLIPLLVPAIYVQNKFPNQSVNSLKKSIEKFSLQKMMRTYIVSFFLAIFLERIAKKSGGLAQILYWIVDIKWVFFLLFGYACFLRNEKKNIFYLFVASEFIYGFYSFFADFKTVVFFVFILMISLVNKLDIRLIIRTVLLAVVLVIFGLVWTSIKGKYRAFLNAGTTTQNVTVSSDEALGEVYDLTSETVSDNTLQGSSNVAQLLDRLQYVYFFAKTINRIPDIMPYQNGQNWLDNLEFTTTPRFLNPDKPILDQTEKTKQYTGLYLAGKKKGVSFSLGYFAECYVDYGPQGMMILLLVIGIMYAWFYNYLLWNASASVVFNYCVTCVFFYEFILYALDGTFILGRFFSGVVTFYFLIKFFFPAVIKYISTQDTNRI